MNALVSLISPVYNAMPYLMAYLDCLKAQSYRPIQALLVDDGSTDGSREYMDAQLPTLEKAGLKVTVLHRPHGGQAAAFNAALPLIRGEFFTWCDADDLLTPDSIEKKVTWLQAHPDIGMVRSNGLVLNGDTGEVLSESATEHDRRQQNVFEDLFLEKTYCYAGCYMVRTALFRQCYPDMRIPESPEGQNLQLLLPPASRTQCGFLEEALHTYCRRRSGHSSQSRSYSQTLRRLENFTALRLRLLEYCSCDRAHYAALAKKLEEKRRAQLVHSALLQARKEQKHEYRNSDLP